MLGKSARSDAESLYQRKALVTFIELLGAELFDPPRARSSFADSMVPRYKALAEKYGWGCACKWDELVNDDKQHAGEENEEVHGDAADAGGNGAGAGTGWDVDEDDESTDGGAPLTAAMFARHVAMYKVFLRSLPPSNWMAGIDVVLIESLVEMMVRGRSTLQLPLRALLSRATLRVS